MIGCWLLPWLGPRDSVPVDGWTPRDLAVVAECWGRDLLVVAKCWGTPRDSLPVTHSLPVIASLPVAHEPA